MELTFGQAQVFTSERLKNRKVLAKLFNKVFGYTNVGNYARFTIFKKLVDRADLKPDAKILDLGTGYGEYAISLGQALPQAEVHALDIDHSRINTVKEALENLSSKNITAHCNYVEEIEQNNFDFIFSIDVFEHLDPNLMPFKTAFEKLKSGGHFLVKIPNVDQKTILNEKYFDEHHDWLEEEHIGQIYDLEGLKKRFENEGFKVIYSSYSDGWLSRAAWEIAYLGKKLSVATQLLTLPIAKGLIHLDRLFHGNKWGNAIQVIGVKP